MKAVIGGTGVLGSELFKGLKKKEVKTAYGPVTLFMSNGLCFVQRHGEKTPPRSINHHANIEGLKDAGCRQIIAIASVGSLKKGIRPGDLMVIDDYMQLTDIPSFYTDRLRFTRPYISETGRRLLLTAAQRLGLKVIEKGVYVQTRGNRFETRAEVRMLSQFADVVGMTLASEATLANEAGIPYAAVCSIDNYAHGIVTDSISSERIVENQRRNLRRIQDLIGEALE